MIKTKRDLEEYLLVDETANHFNKSFLGLFDLRKKFFRRLRKTEYLNNHCNGLFGKLHLNVSKFLLYRLTQKTGYEINGMKLASKTQLNFMVCCQHRLS